MTKTQALTLLDKHNACEEAKTWASGNGHTWATCKRADWMLWLAARVGVDRKLIVLAACDIARTTLKHIPAGELRPRRLIEAAEAWTRGEATPGQVYAARQGALDCRYAAYVAAAASAYSATDAAVADAADAATVAYAAAAYAAAADAADADADADAARRKSLADNAKLVRARIKWSVIEAAVEVKP